MEMEMEMEMETQSGGGGGPEPDPNLISGLPDDVLHDILLRVGSLPAAARTSVLSRRWRRVWTTLPELHLRDTGTRPISSFLRAVDAALAACSAPTLSNLTIGIPFRNNCSSVPAPVVSSWLCFASTRVAGRLRLTIAINGGRNGGELELPPCERATGISLVLIRYVLRLRAPGPGLFAALTDLQITTTNIHGGDLAAFVSSMCPRLRSLSLCVKLVDDNDKAISIRSASLRRLDFSPYFVRRACRLEVAAPRLETLVLSHSVHAHVSAPELAEADLNGLQRHQFADDVPRRLRRLSIALGYMTAEAPPRMPRWFDAVDELSLRARIEKEWYSHFLDDVHNLPKCEALSVSLEGRQHGFVPSMLHLLRRLNGIRKLVLQSCDMMELENTCLLSCPCRLPESYRADNIALDSLEEIEINDFAGSDDQVEFLKLLLSRCSSTSLTSVDINNSFHCYTLSEEVVEKIRIICRPNIIVKIHDIISNRGFQN